MDLAHRDYLALAAFRLEIRKFLHFSETAAKEEGLEPQQHQLMLAVKAATEDAAPTVHTLAAQLMIRHHSAVGLIDRLEQRGMVQRVRTGGDRREVHVRLTAEGEHKLDRLTTAHRDELRQSAPALVAALEALLTSNEIPHAR